MLRENIVMSWDNIRSNKMRSFLTSLGIVIGVSAVIALITIVQSVTGAMMSQFESLGAGKITVMTPGSPLKQGLNLSDIGVIQQVPNVSGVAPTLSVTATAGRPGLLVDKVQIQGRSNLFFTSENAGVLNGRGLTAADMGSHSYVCVIDQKLSQNIFQGNDPIGQNITLEGQGFEVVGVRATPADDITTMMSGGGRTTDGGSAIIPYQTAMLLTSVSGIRNIEIYLDDPIKSADTITAVESTLDSIFNYKDNSYSVINMQSVVDMMGNMQTMLTSLLAGIASIALIVGGIGIMNMMLVSVTERTKEIGLRKALGAEPLRIQVQFVTEAVFLSLIGGVAGVFGGLAIALIATKLLSTAFIISWWAILLGAGFSIAVGLVFGWAPAKKASMLKPIDALRSE